MPGITTALAVGLGTAGALGGAAISAHGAGKQADAALQSSQAAVAEQRRQFDVTQRNLQPWLNVGSQALQQLQFLMGLGVPPGQAIHTTASMTGVSPANLIRLQQLGDGSGGGPLGFADSGAGPAFQRRFGVNEPPETPTTPDRTGNLDQLSALGSSSTGGPASGGFDPTGFGSLQHDFSTTDFQTDPGYEFRLSEGQKALERSAAARGTVLSGGTLKALTQYNQGFASNEFTNAYNRFQQNRTTRYNQLASLAGLGQTTAAQLGSFGAQNANTIGNLIVGGQTSAAAARASGYNAIGSAVGGIGNNLMNWYLLSKMGG